MTDTPKKYSFNSDPLNQEVKKFISNGHYSGSCPGISKAFTLEENGITIGACVFSSPSRQNITVPNADKIIELSRLYIIDNTPKNTESYFIGKCLKWLQKNTEYEAVVSFADTTMGHVGTIYKATNFKFLGQTKNGYHYENCNKIRVHKKTLWDKAKKEGRTEADQAEYQKLVKVPELPKNKYVYYLKPEKSNNIIYILIHPVTKEVRYVGKTERGAQRIHDHLKPSALKQPTRKNNWINKMKNDEGLDPLLVPIEHLKTPEELFSREKYWYDHYIKLGANLTNSTECGQGTTGYKHKESTKELLSKLKIGKNKGKALPEGMWVAKPVLEISGIKYKECSLCKALKAMNDFGYTKKSDSYHSYCKPCYSAYRKQTRLKAPRMYAKCTPEEEKRLKLEGSKKAGEMSKDPARRANISKKNSKFVQGVNVQTGEVITFESGLKAKEAGFDNTYISTYAKKGRPFKGYMWSIVKKAA